MKKSGVQLLIVLLIGLGSALTCYGYQEFVEITGQDCATCHVEPAGGVELTEVGQGYLLTIDPDAFATATGSSAKKVSAWSWSIQLIVRYLHLLAAFFWFGTILYVHLVFKPAYASRGLPPGEVRVGLISIVVVGLTGIVLGFYRVPGWEFFIDTRFGFLLLLKILLFLFLVVSALAVVLILGPKLKPGPQPAAEPEQIGDMTATQLVRFNGREGRPALFGYAGGIYDASNSSLWKEGGHMGRHEAGVDLTDGFASAPHGAEVIERMERVGRLLPAEAEAGEKSSASPLPVKVFYFMAYLNLAVVLAVILILSMWRL